MANPPADTTLTHEQIKCSFPITDMSWPLTQKRFDAVFYWYFGHDPYNSADNKAFMERIAR